MGEGPKHTPTAVPTQSSTEHGWELKRKHACISADVELLSFEVRRSGLQKHSWNH